MVRNILYFVALSLSFTMTSLKIVKIPRPGAKKILIVSFADIGGHASLTKALTSFLKNTHEVHVIKSEDFEKYGYPDNGYYEIMKSSVLNAYFMQVRHHIMCNFLLRLPYFFINLLFKIDEFYEILDQNKYAMVIFTSPCHPNEISRACENRKIPSVMIAPDFGNPSNTYEFYVREEYSVNILPMNAYFDINKKHNVLPLSGIPVRPEFSYIRNISKQEAKRQIRLDPQTPCVLVMMGASGANDILEIAEYVKHDTKKTYVFMCGKNEDAHAKLTEMNVENFVVLKYVSSPMMYMRAADVLIGKPGGISTTEAIQCETPCVFKSDSVFGFLPSEVPNARYIVENGMGCVIDDYADLVTTINHMLKTQYYFPYNNALEQVVHMIRRITSDKNMRVLPYR